MLEPGGSAVQPHRSIEATFSNGNVRGWACLVHWGAQCSRHLRVRSKALSVEIRWLSLVLVSSNSPNWVGPGQDSKLLLPCPYPVSLESPGEPHKSLGTTVWHPRLSMLWLAGRTCFLSCSLLCLALGAFTYCLDIAVINRRQSEERVPPSARN